MSRLNSAKSRSSANPTHTARQKAPKPKRERESAADFERRRSNRFINRSMKRDYQVRAVKIILKYVNKEQAESPGSERMLVVAPTGAGKTFMAVDVMYDVYLRTRKQTLVLVPNVDLVKQWKDAITALGRYKPLVMGESHPEIGVMRGEETCAGDEEIIIATWHTLHYDEERLEKLYPQSFGLVIVDECHGAAAPCWSTILNYFNGSVPISGKKKRSLEDMSESVITERNPDGTTYTRHFCEEVDDEENEDEDEYTACAAARLRPDNGERVPIVGFSATPDCFRPVEMPGVFPIRIDTVSIGQLVKEAVLCKMSYVGFTGYFGSPATRSNAHNPPLPAADGQTPTSVAQRFEQREDLESKPVLPVLYSLNEGIIKNWEICREQGRRSTLIFCQSIRAVDALQSEFDDRHIPAASVTGKNRFQDRLAILKKFNEGSIEGSSTAAP